MWLNRMAQKPKIWASLLLAIVLVAFHFYFTWMLTKTCSTPPSAQVQVPKTVSVETDRPVPSVDPVAAPSLPPAAPPQIVSAPANANAWLREVLGNINAPKYSKLLPLLDDTLTKEYDKTDPELIDIVKKKYLIQPPSKDVPYRLGVDSNFDTSMGQSKKVMEILKNKTNGFFMECGALDGEKRSNTLIFERKFGWQGVLVEADPINLMNCFDTNRKVWLVPACLSTQKSSMHVQYRAWEHIGAIVDQKAIHNSLKQSSWMEKMVNVTCIPFDTIMTALQRSSVDYLSLDVEGNELDILKTIDFKKFDIKVISAEFAHEQELNATKDDMGDFMKQKGYSVHSMVTHPGGLANDFIFVKD